MNLSADQITTYVTDINAADNAVLLEIATELGVDAPKGRTDAAKKAALIATVEAMLDTDQSGSSALLTEAEVMELATAAVAIPAGSSPYFDKEMFINTTHTGKVMFLADKTRAVFQKKSGTSTSIAFILNVDGNPMHVQLSPVELNLIKNSAKFCEIPNKEDVPVQYHHLLKDVVGAAEYVMSVSATGKVKAA